ncbi:MAG: TVP38/TMEM64 family protein [Acidobacteriota bacterium]
MRPATHTRRTKPASEAAAGASRTARRPWLKPLLLGVAIVALLAAMRALGLGDRLGEVRAWILGLGAWGPAVFVSLYAIAVVAAIPGSLLTIAAGAMFGSALGVGLVSLGSTLGAALAFAVARWFARESVSQWLAGNAAFARLDRMTDEHGAIVVAITRLIPIFPFTLLNYGFGLTRVPFRTYVLWSWLCMLPGTILYVVGADAVVKGLAEGRVPWPLIGVVAGMAITLTFIVRRARRALRHTRSGS